MRCLRSASSSAFLRSMPALFSALAEISLIKDLAVSRVLSIAPSWALYFSTCSWSAATWRFSLSVSSRFLS